MKQLSAMYIEHHQDSDTGLVQKLSAYGVEAARATLPFDINWTVDGKNVCFDMKTPEDAIASAQDGRLHNQLEAMKARGAVLYGFGIEGPFGQDGQTIGYGPHAWSYHRFDNLLLTLQVEGAVLFHCWNQAHTAARLASIYKWSAKEEHGSFHAPVRPTFTLKQPYLDGNHRKHVEIVMAIFPGVGEELANRLLDRYPLTHILGITPEGMDVAFERWQTVRGIGKGKASIIRQLLEEDFSSPLVRGNIEGGNRGLDQVAELAG